MRTEYNHLEDLLHLFQHTNFILITSFVFQATTVRNFFCSTFQLVFDSEENVSLFGLPEGTAALRGCSRWRFYDFFKISYFGAARLPWLRNVATSHPRLINSVIRSACIVNCNTTNSFRILSHKYNFTLTDCQHPYGSCDFIEFDNTRAALASIASGTYLPLNTFKSQSFAFLAPEGAQHPKWEYLARPFKLSVWLGILSSVTTFLFLVLLSLRCQRSTFSHVRKHLWRLFEFLICSLFAPVPLPTRIKIPAVLLLVWTLLMQIPATGFRAVMISCLNEPPRKKPISDTSELSAMLGTKTDPMVLCLESTNELWALYEIYDKELFAVAEGSGGYSDYNMTNIYSFHTFYKTALSKVRYSGCRDYVRNGTGAFFGNEDRLIAVLERDIEIASNQFTRLEFLPDIACSSYGNPYRTTLSKSLLRLFESHVEAHLNALRHMKGERQFLGLNYPNLSPHKVEDLWHFFQFWFFGILIASITFILERVCSRCQACFS